MEFKTKAALAEWSNDQTIPEIAAYYKCPAGRAFPGQDTKDMLTRARESVFCFPCRLSAI
jgi:hypothetical protein